jgi:hypothetical protein
MAHIQLSHKPVFEKIKYRYNFGREISNNRIENEKIYLPIDENEKPDWAYMESYVKSLENKVEFKKIQTKNKRKYQTIDKSSWKEFDVYKWFDVIGTKTTPLYDLEITYGKGEYPYITTRATNNGVAGFYDHKTENGNILVADSAVVGFVSYQEKDFSASDHVEKLIPNFEMNKYIALFLRTIFMKGSYKYAYGRKFNQDRIKATKLLLPITKNGLPDWNYMENYIKNLAYGDLI